MKTEIEDKGGDASIFAADAVDQWSDDGLVEEFRRVRQEAYGKLAAEIEQVLAERRRRASKSRVPRPSRALGERFKSARAHRLLRQRRTRPGGCPSGSAEAARHSAPDAPTVGALIDGLQLTTSDDADLLERGITMFEALYRAFALAQPAPRPRSVARRRPARRQRRRS